MDDLTIRQRHLHGKMRGDSRIVSFVLSHAEFADRARLVVQRSAGLSAPHLPRINSLTYQHSRAAACFTAFEVHRQPSKGPTGGAHRPSPFGSTPLGKGVLSRRLGAVPANIFGASRSSPHPKRMLFLRPLLASCAPRRAAGCAARPRTRRSAPGTLWCSSASVPVRRKDRSPGRFLRK